MLTLPLLTSQGNLAVLDKPQGAPYHDAPVLAIGRPGPFFWKLEMGNLVVIGAQWGDEGKANIVDILARHADAVVRYQGGSNAGHTVINDRGTFIFHLVPSGILYRGTLCVIGNGGVVAPPPRVADMCLAW